MINVNVFMREYIEIKSSSVFQEHDVDTFELLKIAENDDTLRKLYKNIHYAGYRTIYNNQDAVMLVFSIMLENVSEQPVIDLVQDLTKHLNNLDYRFVYLNRIEKKRKVAYLKVIKIISEKDII